ncbi:predicted protein [Lichtheimia corymbifera JMRC:FSU:9682]|uniref:Uncharacterized protein n=1 Tax=Lichtheimia corymbifera JMRC:FSU:9682 TaxID=1263082 RepID=A0A068SHG3_9FUNG|nr:predicted protein [Lichtheimia corymbifera JMRC:FSU:9682]
MALWDIVPARCPSHEFRVIVEQEDHQDIGHLWYSWIQEAPLFQETKQSNRVHDNRLITAYDGFAKT